MDFQSMLDTMATLDRQTRSKYHLTLGGLIDFLRASRPGLPVVYADGKVPGKFGSYRGYYSDLAIADGDDAPTAMDFEGSAQRCVCRTFQGWKGGAFLMERNTPLWRAEEGCTGAAIVDAKAESDRLILVTKYLDDDT